MPDAEQPGYPYDAWADYYDLTSGDRSHDIAFYRGLVSDRMRWFAELGCGTGTVMIPLAQDMISRHGSPPNVGMVGVDISQHMLRIARAREPRVDWIRGDILRPALSGRFDLVICCFNTLQSLLTDVDLAQALAAARSLLGPKGIFAFDIYQPNLSYIRPPRRNRLAWFGIDNSERHLEVREDSAYDEDSQVLSLYWRLIERGRECAPPIATIEYRMRQYFAADIERLVLAAGLAVCQRYGDFDKAPFTRDSKKQVLVCGLR